MGNDDRRDTMLQSPKPHHLALEEAAFEALSKSDFAAAFMYSDRRCRLGSPVPPYCYVLRAEAARGLGRLDIARTSLRRATDGSPADLAANRGLLVWGDDEDRLRAAEVLVARETQVRVLQKAIATLTEFGRSRHARVDISEQSISGWAVWDSDPPIEITIRTGAATETRILPPDPFHPLSSRSIRATAFEIRRPLLENAQAVTLSLCGQPFYARPIDLRNLTPPAAGSSTDLGGASRIGTTTVIIPVYADFEATKTCLDSVVADRCAGGAYRILAINDASPDPRIADLMISISNTPGVEVVTNPFNLGFVGTVNRALASVASGDVVLLNADTIVPPGFVQRLAGVASTSRQIGTVVPLTNNGEFTSFPVIYSDNPLPSGDVLLAFDRIAEARNAGAIIDIPSGTGFCMYITRACLDAVGLLSDDYDRGYLEDVDFCLRAREHGFRNVCATSIFVGHAGGRSFKSEKRLLVTRNLEVLKARFPSYLRECRTFLDSDPLRPARAAIELALPQATDRPTLVFAAKAPLTAVAENRIGHLEAHGTSCIALGLHGPSPGTLTFAARNGRPPQSVSFNCADATNRTALRRYLSVLNPGCCEVVDPGEVPKLILDVLTDLAIPIDVWVSDGSAFGDDPVEQRGKSGCSDPGFAGHADARKEFGRDSVNSLIRHARRIIAPTRMAQSYLLRIRPELSVARADLGGASGSALELRLSDVCAPSRAVVVLTPFASASEFDMIKDMALLLREQASDISVVVAGATTDDLALLSLGNVFVTGRVEAGQLGEALLPHNVCWAVCGSDRPLFGHPALELVYNAQLPVAYHDWSFGAVEPRPFDLALNPRMPQRLRLNSISSWMDSTQLRRSPLGSA
jgi:GT2 family glycosyltransferase